METLQADVKDLGVQANRLSSISTTSELVAFIQNSLVPFIESQVIETVEIDGCVNDMLENAEDILQVETSEMFGTLIALGTAMATELKSKNPSPELTAVIVEFEQTAAKATATLAEITVVEVEDEEDEEDEDDDAK